MVYVQNEHYDIALNVHNRWWGTCFTCHRILSGFNPRYDTCSGQAIKRLKPATATQIRKCHPQCPDWRDKEQFYYTY